MYLVDTDERLLEHVEGWLIMAQGTFKAIARERRQNKPGVTLNDLSYANGRVIAMKDCLGLIKAHVEQSEKKES